MNKKIIPVFLTIDDGYVPYLSVALISLIDNASNKYNYNIHIVHDGITKKNQEILKKLETNNVNIIFNLIKDKGKDIIDRKENLLRTDFFTLTIFFRLFIPHMFPEYDKAIYIDSDTCIPGDISELYNYDLKDNLFGGCNDISCMNNKVLCKYFKENAGVSIDKYINSGVLLMNMKKLREVDFEKHFLYLFNKYHFDTICPDQDYINAMAYGHILHLPNEWDVMPTNGDIVFQEPKIIHYNLFRKPWHFNNVDYEDYFWKYVNMSPYKDEIYNVKKNYTKKMQTRDLATLDNMVSRAIEIMNSGKSFKKVFESGKEKRI